MSLYTQSFPPPAYVVRPEVVIELAYHQPQPPMPPELRPALGEKEYSERMCTLTRLLGRYSWSNMMRIYTALVFALTLLVPLILVLVTNKVLAEEAFNDEGELVDVDKLKEARGIQAGVFIGIICLLWFPWWYLKHRGDKAIEGALKKFNVIDQAKGSMQNISWRMTGHSLYIRRAVVAVRMPSAYTGPPSVFHPQAYHNLSGFAPPAYPRAPNAPVSTSPPKEAGVYPLPPREPPSDNPFADAAALETDNVYAPPRGPPPTTQGH